MTQQEIPFRLTVVYSRQSRYGGGSFSSCDAQYAICYDTATSLGLPVHDHFADEGESSETLDRPAMQELINAVQEGLIERVIVYKVDRLVKPLAMLAELLAIFEEHEINWSSSRIRTLDNRRPVGWPATSLPRRVSFNRISLAIGLRRCGPR